MLLCPVCTHASFNTFEALCQCLLSAVTRQLVCPMCPDILSGLDKFTIHMFTHAFHLKSNIVIKKDSTSQTISDHICQPNASQMGEQEICLISYTKETEKNINSEYKNEKLPILSSPLIDNEALIMLKDTDFDLRHESKTSDSISTFKANGDTCNLTSMISSENLSSRVMLSDISHLKELSVKDPTIAVTNQPSVSTDILYCDICKFSFSDISILEMHQQLVHSADSYTRQLGKQLYPCHLCSKSFKMKGSLMVHMRVAHGAGISVSKLLKKQVEDNNGELERKFNCSTCGKSFRKEQHLNQHLKTHDGKQWECDVCFKLFTTKYFLKKHKRLHTGEMPYCCPTCKKTFTFQQSYHKHLLYHSDEKPHVCAECDRSFKELSTLHNHQRIHTGEKPFACETCGKCFRQRVSYLVHRRIHTGAMPYKCTACGKNFRYKVSQRTHKCPMQPPGVVIKQTGELSKRIFDPDDSEYADKSCAISRNVSSKEMQYGNSTSQLFLVLENDLQAHISSSSLIVLPQNSCQEKNEPDSENSYYSLFPGSMKNYQDSDGCNIVNFYHKTNASHMNIVNTPKQDSENIQSLKDKGTNNIPDTLKMKLTEEINEEGKISNIVTNIAYAEIQCKEVADKTSNASPSFSSGAIEIGDSPKLTNGTISSITENCLINDSQSVNNFNLVCGKRSQSTSNILKHHNDDDHRNSILLPQNEDFLLTELDELSKFSSRCCEPLETMNEDSLKQLLYGSD